MKNIDDLRQAAQSAVGKRVRRKKDRSKVYDVIDVYSDVKLLNRTT